MVTASSTTDDRTFIGNPIPRMSYGLNLTAENRGFDLSALIQGVQGVDKYNDAKKITGLRQPSIQPHRCSVGCVARRRHEQHRAAHDVQ